MFGQIIKKKTKISNCGRGNLWQGYASCIKMVGAVAQSVERGTPGEKVLGLIPAVAARSVLVGSVSE